MTDSWRLKLQRADQHLGEVNGYITTYENERVYRTRRTPDPNGDQDIWRYVLDITEQPDERLPIAIGDMVHNMRCALDHILVAMRPRKYKRNKGFPILTANPWEGALTKQRANDQAAFCEAVAGLPGEAITTIRDLQPFVDHGDGHSPLHNALHVINRLDNADKHREPIITVPGMVVTGTVVTARGDQLVQQHPTSASGYPGLVEHGTEVAHFRWVKPPPLTEPEVNVDVRGTPLVALDVGITDGYMEARNMLAVSLRWFWEEIIPALEHHLPGR